MALDLRQFQVERNEGLQMDIYSIPSLALNADERIDYLLRLGMEYIFRDR
jgi:hypothetical protein